jgi:hypothetical protein
MPLNWNFPAMIGPANREQVSPSLVIVISLRGLIRFMIAEVNNDCIWAEQNFRPIDPRKTDISVFQRLLVNPEERIDA